jgi:DNA-binding LacI/PurR family transcriptional regulator
MKPTIRDVAKKANVSVATVSRVINEKGYVYEETRKTVLKIIDELGFEPNQLARSLTNHRSKMIGVIVPHIGTTFYGQLIEGIEHAALSYGYKTMLCNTQDNSGREIDYLKIFEQYNVEGIIVASNFLNKDKLEQLNIPVVTIDHLISDDYPSITCNNENGGQVAAKALIESGAKNILLLRGPSFLITSQERTKGFLEITEQYGCTVDIHDFDLIEPDAEFIYQYLKNNPHVDGIFAMSDTLALIALGCLQQLGRKIPKDVSLVGFDDAPFTKWTSPAISTVSQSVKYMGSESINLLIKSINNEQIPNKHISVEVTYKPRQTTK